MASTAKCAFCGAVVTSDQKQCPDCGADNPHYTEDRPEWIIHPTTIDELKEYCAERGMPLLRMRFFIGEDFREPRAFGIYRDGDRFIVYKNKADGSRAVRYSGPDEKYAVNELWSKLLQECHNRGIYPDGRPDSGSTRTLPDGSGNAGGVQRRTKKHIKPIFLIRLIFLIVFIAALFYSQIYDRIRSDAESKPLSKGYYYLNNQYYYTESSWYSSATWYSYDSTGWKSADPWASVFSIRHSYKGDTVSPDWGIRAIPLHEEPEKGYYQKESLYYFEGGYKWYKFDTSDKRWLSSSALTASKGYLLYYSDYYLGPDFTEDMPGFDFLAAPGYYRKNGETWYYGDGLWHLYDGRGWKKSDSPAKTVASLFEGEACQEEWEIREFPVEARQEGYYRYRDQVYYYGKEVRSVSGWAEFNKNTGKWNYSSGFPAYDPEGYILYLEDYYGGASFPAEWEGRDYKLPEGYYRYQGVTYYFSEKGPDWRYALISSYAEELYRYENGWKRSGYPVGNLKDYYEGTSDREEWKCSAFRLPGIPEPGYYRLEDRLFYAIQATATTKYSSGNLWYEYKDGSWTGSSFPFFNADDYLIYPEDYFLGAEYSADWGGSAFHVSRGYYRINGSIYYANGNRWYKYGGLGWTVMSSSPASDYDQYFAGNSMPEAGTSFDTWEREQNSRKNNSVTNNGTKNSTNNNTRYERWDNSDYDDWDIGDTDWDSDW